MPVRKLPSGRWQVRVWDADRGTHPGIGTYPTGKEARKAEARHEAGIEEPKPEQPKPEQPKPVVRGRQKFGQYALEILEARKHTLKPGTWHAYAWSLKTHLATFQKVPLPDITEWMVVKWWRSMEDQKHARKAAYAVLSMVMKRALRAGKIVKSPCTIEGASRDVSSKRPMFHAADVRMMMELSRDDQMKASLGVLLGTGVRVGEMLALDWQDLARYRRDPDAVSPEMVFGALWVHGSVRRSPLRPGGSLHIWIATDSRPDADHDPPERRSLPSGM